MEFIQHADAMKSVTGLEVFVAAMVVVWGIVLALPGSLFDGPSAAVYAPMAARAPEGVWASCCLVLGLGQLLGLFLYKRLGRRVTPLRIVALALDAAFYGYVAGMFATVPGVLLGPSVWTCFALAAIWTALHD